MSNNSRPVYEKPVYNIIIPVRDFSLDKAIPQFAAAIDAQIDCDDTSDDFIEEILHSTIRSSSTDSMARRQSVRGGRTYRAGHSAPLSPPRYFFSFGFLMKPK
jgi:hypothetical protein